ncbi:tRNA pseudouridine(38-40) synthase TruA [Verrucomicrobia bacterium]|nr:tRNA pseudouridine(38-40) synthase TruA [Verrucomicrobiota bacterium]
MERDDEFQKFKLVIAFDGTAFQGWQIQKTGTGVQQVVNEAVQKLFPGAKSICGSSRTDSGVHARGMVAHVEIPKIKNRVPLRRMPVALNAFLPQDIRIQEVTEEVRDFHAQYSAKGKQYRYYIRNHQSQDPVQRHQVWHVIGNLDLDAMKEAATYFVGKHNFRSIAGTLSYERSSYVRNLTKVDVLGEKPDITIIIEGDGFLYKMCRNIVGTIVQVGQGKIAAGDVKEILEKEDRRAAGMSAPAHGLTLWEVFY